MVVADSIAPQHRLGAVLLAAGFALGAWLDVACVGQLDLVDPQLRVARLTQVSLFRMGLLQFLWVELLRVFDLSGAERWLRLGMGTALGYALIEILRISLPAAGVCSPVFAMAHLGIALVLFRQARAHENPLIARTITATVALGFLVDIGVGLAEARPDAIPFYFGGIDEVRFRMFRLARVAAIVLPLLLALHVTLNRALAEGEKGHKWSWRAARVGSVGMPWVLVLTALTFVARKGPLFIMTLEMMAATAWSVAFARRQGRGVERWGWALVFASMFAGLGLSAFAFNGPFPVPEALGDYAHLPRRLSRVAHIYGIVVGVLWILRGRGLAFVSVPGAALGIAGVTTLLVPLAVATGALPGPALALGPAALALLALVALRAHLRRS